MQLRPKSFLVAVALLVLSSPLYAQRPQTRQGFWFNLGLGYGSAGCDESVCDGREGGFSGGLSLGGTLGPKLLLGVGTAGWTKSEGAVTITLGTVDARIRFYPSATGGFFLTGGLGLGTVYVKIDGVGSDTETGLAALVGLGFDIRIGANSSLTPFWNGFAINTDDGFNVWQIGLGITIH